MNRWLQSQIYACSRCGTSYLHDKAHQHACFECPARPVVPRPVPVEQVYEPKVAR